MKRRDGGLLVLCALAGATLAAAHAGNVADAAHDAGVARVLGLDPQPWRALDALVGSVFSVLPVGTRAARAALGQALVVGAAGAALYVVTRRLLDACARTEKLGSAVAAIATLAAVAAPPWQLEGAVAGGSATGALLVLLPVALLAGAPRVRWEAVVGAVALALGHEPLVGACAMAACAAFVGAEVLGARAGAGTGATAGADAWRSLLSACRTDARKLLAWAALGLMPFLLAFARTRASGASLLSALGDGWAGERAASAAGSPLAFARAELGTVLAALVLGGVVLSMLVARARPVASALVAILVLGVASAWLGAPVGPSRIGAPVLAAFASACALSGVAMQAIVRAVSETRVPFARASAAMVLVLELVIPVDSADEALVRARPRAGAAVAAWDDVAWGALPPRAVVLVTDARVERRARAARARGALRGDVAVVPALDAPRGLAQRVLASDPALVPLWRDLALAGMPSEASLSSLAAARPLAMAYEPRWGRMLGKHLVPQALLDRFQAEPRGASDRKKALEAFLPLRERLARAAKGDAELADATAYLLRARALEVAASGDRDLVGRAVEDLHAFAPDDAVAKDIVARTVLGKSARSLDDLRP